jgi:hypothetical protein
MLGYGLPRNKNVEYPDIADIQHYGLNTSAGGKRHQKSNKKRRARRLWKKIARRIAKKYCRHLTDLVTEANE